MLASAHRHGAPITAAQRDNIPLPLGIGGI